MRIIPQHLTGVPRGRLLSALRRLSSEEPLLFGAALVFLSCAYLFVRLADAVKEGDTQQFDECVLRSLRRADNPALPVGPRWLRKASLDVTALGSPAVLVLVLAAVVGYLLVRGKYGLACLTLLATTGGALLGFLLKHAIHRDRPTVVPHLQEVSTLSFPSSHALLSAVVYLTLGILLAQSVPDRAAKLYCLAWAMVLPFLVGISRIYLGVHYPTDVVAGWMVGLAWALACWGVARALWHEDATAPSAASAPKTCTDA